MAKLSSCVSQLLWSIGHAAHARLDQPAGHQARLAERVAAVLVAELVGLGVDVERLLGGGRGHQVERLLRGRRSTASARLLASSLGRLLEAIDLAQQLAGERPAGRPAGLSGGTMSGTAKSGAARIGLDHERRAGRAEIGRAAAGCICGKQTYGGTRPPSCCGPSLRAMIEPSEGRWLFGVRFGLKPAVGK